VQPPDFHQETDLCSLSPESAAKNPEPMISSQFSQCKYASWCDFSITNSSDCKPLNFLKKTVLTNISRRSGCLPHA